MIPEPHAELVDEHPTEAAARTAASTDQPYRGQWWTPPPLPGRVHLFADPGVYPDALLLDTGWTRAERIEYDATTFGDLAAGQRRYVRPDGTSRIEPWEGA